jgi:hypothetical protein
VAESRVNEGVASNDILSASALLVDIFSDDGIDIADETLDRRDRFI